MSLIRDSRYRRNQSIHQPFFRAAPRWIANIERWKPSIATSPTARVRMTLRLLLVGWLIAL